MNKNQTKRTTKKIVRFSLIGQRVSSGNKKLDKLVGFLFILGLILLYLEILIFRETIIDLTIPLIIWLTPGVVMTPLLYGKMNNIDGMKAHWSLHYVLHTCMTGAFILYFFMASNFYLADNQIEKKSFKIIRTGSLPGPKGSRNEREPYVFINYEGLEKQLLFSFNVTDKINSAKEVELSVRKGFFGFDILDKYEVE